MIELSERQYNHPTRWILFYCRFESNSIFADAIMIDDGKILTTLLLEKNKAIEKQMHQIAKFNLSKAEMCIVEKYFFGFSNYEISDQLFISVATLRTHLNNIYKKMNVKDQSGGKSCLLMG